MSADPAARIVPSESTSRLVASAVNLARTPLFTEGSSKAYSATVLVPEAPTKKLLADAAMARTSSPTRWDSGSSSFRFL